MIFLWAFLLLAVATGSVQSQACSCPCSIHPMVQDTFEREVNRFPALQIDPVLNLGLVSTIVNPILNSITNLAITSASVNTVILNNGANGLDVHFASSLNANSNEINSFVISVNVNYTLNVRTVNGSANWGYLDSSLLIQININGNTLTVTSVVTNALVNTVRPLLEEVVKTILALVSNTLNNFSGSLKVPYYIGGMGCRHQARNIQMVNGWTFADLCTFIGSRSTCWDKVGDMSMAENEYHLINVPNNILRSIVAQMLNLISVKINLAKEDLACYILISNYGSDFYLAVGITVLNDCAFREDGVNLFLDLEIQIYSGKISVATATAVLTVTAQASLYHGYLSLYVDVNSQADLNLKVTFKDDKCGCADTISELFKKVLKLHLNVLLGELNCKFKRLLELPVIGGEKGRNGQCVSKKDYCRCALSR